jgi:hypothetical protein
LKGGFFIGVNRRIKQWFSERDFLQKAFDVMRRLLPDQKALAVLSRDPFWRLAAPTPGTACFWILIARRQRRLFGRPAAPGGGGESQILCGKPIFDDLVTDLGDHVDEFRAARLFGLRLKPRYLNLEVCVL